ncbi:diacylglycerol kinase family protein [Candidatus Parcubacteria bacterium]|jgi:undecaprenol kinase|nr:diacylglycerol kinase family protein [Candidatus Parcubacteria bacterium]MBT3948748.1 diacylglycerol kinase family protein [Candidatus Parcubacteria bacterium]
MNVKRLIQSFKDAGRGVSFVYKNEQNFRIQLFFALVVIVSMFALGVRTSERIVILLLIILVVVLEFINTIIEKFLDLLKPRLHGHVEVIKDVMAAAVLISSIGSLVIGYIIFMPYIVELVF